MPAAAANESWNEASNSSSGEAQRIASAATPRACAAVVRRRAATAPSHANATIHARTVATCEPVRSVYAHTAGSATVAAQRCTGRVSASAGTQTSARRSPT